MSSYKATLSSDDLPSSGGYADDVLRDRRNGSVPSFRQNSYVNMMEVIPNEPAQSKAPVVHFWDFGSLYLENKGSVARDHLASERTFLAWLRTSLSFATIGVGVTQLFKLSSSPDLEGNEMAKFARPLGLLFVLTSIVTLLFGVFRYFMIQKLLIDGLFPASRLFIGILLLIVSVLIVLTMVIVCLGNVQEL